MKRVFLLFIVWWLVLQSFALAAFYRFRIAEPDRAYAWIQPATWWFPARDLGFVQLHVRWDSGVYIRIAQFGYGPAEAAFFPLYPLLTRMSGDAIAFITQHTTSDDLHEIYHVAALVISNLSALGSALVLFNLARLDLEEDDALRAVFYFLIFPAAFFLSVIYTEALFLFLSLASLHAARRERWWLAGIAGGLAAMTRSGGVLLLLPLGWEFVARYRAKPLNRHLPSLALAPLGLVVFAIILQYTLGDYRIFFESQKDFAHWFFWSDWPSTQRNLQEYWEFVCQHWPARVNLLFDAGAAVAGLALSLALFRQRASYALYALATLLLPLSTGNPAGFLRYSFAAFPIFILLARWGRQTIFDRAFSLASILGLALYTMLWVQGYWAS